MANHLKVAIVLSIQHAQGWSQRRIRELGKPTFCIQVSQSRGTDSKCATSVGTVKQSSNAPLRPPGRGVFVSLTRSNFSMLG